MSYERDIDNALNDDKDIKGYCCWCKNPIFIGDPSITDENDNLYHKECYKEVNDDLLEELNFDNDK